MLPCCCARKMEVYASASTFVSWMWESRKTHTHCHRYRKWSRAWLVQNTFPALIKGRVLADHNRWGFKTIHYFYCGEHMILWMWAYVYSGCAMPKPHSKDWSRIVSVSLTWPIVWSTWMTWLSFQRQKRNLYITCTLCLSTSGSNIWSSSQPSVNSLRMRSNIWLIMSPRKVCNPARRSWKLWPNLLHQKPTLKSESFWAWWDITRSLLRDSHISCNHCTSICLEKVHVRRMSM